MHLEWPTPEVLALGASRQSLVGQARLALPDRRLPLELSLLRSLSRARDRWMVLMSMSMALTLTVLMVLMLMLLALLLMLVLQIALRLEVRSLQLQLQLRLVLLLEMEQLRPAQARQMESPALWEPAPLPGSIPRYSAALAP